MKIRSSDKGVKKLTKEGKINVVIVLVEGGIAFMEGNMEYIKIEGHMSCLH